MARRDYRGKAKQEESTMLTKIPGTSIAREVIRQALKRDGIKLSRVPNVQFRRLADELYEIKKEHINNLLDQVVQTLLNEDKVHDT